MKPSHLVPLLLVILLLGCGAPQPTHVTLP